jgi:hypothetical protein
MRNPVLLSNRESDNNSQQPFIKSSGVDDEIKKTASSHKLIRTALKRANDNLTFSSLFPVHLKSHNIFLVILVKKNINVLMEKVMD